MSEDWEEVYTSSCHNCGQDKSYCELENKKKLGFCGNWMPIRKKQRDAILTYDTLTHEYEETEIPYE